MRNHTPTAIERRLTAVEQLPQPRALERSEARDPRDPREMTSLDLFDRLSELRARARWRRLTFCPAFPPGDSSAETIVARIAALRAKAAKLSGTLPLRRAPVLTDELEADDA
jgi:hypothetical protein